jgi:hypothetical protein
MPGSVLTASDDPPVCATPTTSCDSLCQARADYCFFMVKEASLASRLGLPVFVLSRHAEAATSYDCFQAQTDSARELSVGFVS